MRKNFKISLIFIVVIAFIMSALFMSTLYAATTTHEAEASTNNLKYASVSGSYVEFSATKDAYVEMKSVTAPASGTCTLTFVYSNSSGSSVPVEVKVNGTTVFDKEPFANTGGSWANKSVTASMNSGSSNVIRFKIRAAVSGVRLDKVIISTDGSTTTTSSTSSGSSATSTPVTSSSTSSGGSASYTTNSDGTIIVNSGTFDGGNKNYGNIGSGTQDEDQPAVFELMQGASLKNCVIVPPAGDGIHVHGNNTVDNVKFTDVGEDAISMRSDYEGGTVTISNCSFAEADDKVLQVNRSSTWRLNNIVVKNAGKVMRQNGGTTFALTVYIDGLTATGIDEAIVRSDSPNCKVYYRNISCNLPSDEWWMGELSASAY